MRWLLDTNILIGIRDDDAAVLSRFSGLSGLVAMSIVSKVELDNGVYRDPAEAHVRQAALDLLLENFDILPFGMDESTYYRSIVAKLGYSRSRTLDRMIAATALRTRATLVTANIRDFRDVPGLKIEDWSN
jgi:tRNA(fMet)-specific endonuclease VapC